MQFFYGVTVSLLAASANYFIVDPPVLSFKEILVFDTECHKVACVALSSV